MRFWGVWVFFFNYVVLGGMRSMVVKRVIL